MYISHEYVATPPPPPTPIHFVCDTTRVANHPQNTMFNILVVVINLQTDINYYFIRKWEKDSLRHPTTTRKRSQIHFLRVTRLILWITVIVGSGWTVLICERETYVQKFKCSSSNL